MLTYRRDEIEDLIICLGKALDLPGSHNSEDTGGTNTSSSHMSDQRRNDLIMKQETLQLELSSINSELFELEKKYGEVKKREKPS